MEEYNQ